MDDTIRAGRLSVKPTGVLLALTTCVGLLGMIMVGLGRASPLEAVSFVTGAVCVWLTVKENIWNFPIGLANTATFTAVFYEARLFGDSALQIVYFLLGLVGWYLWLYGGERHTRLQVTRARDLELVVVGLAVVASTILLWQTLRLVGGSASFWDASTTSLSLGAQWLLNRKRLENWHLWILADVAYVPLYLSRGLNLTALLYVVFLVMAVMGLVRWRAVWAAGRPESLIPVPAS